MHSSATLYGVGYHCYANWFRRFFALFEFLRNMLCVRWIDLGTPRLFPRPWIAHLDMFCMLNFEFNH